MNNNMLKLDADAMVERVNEGGGYHYRILNLPAGEPTWDGPNEAQYPREALWAAYIHGHRDARADAAEVAAEADARIEELEAQLLEASELLEPHIGHGVGILCVAEAVRALDARLKEAVNRNAKTLGDLNMANVELNTALSRNRELRTAQEKVDGLWAEIDSHRAHVKHLEDSRDAYEKRAEKAEARAEAASKREGESFMLAADIQREKVKLEADAGRLRAVVEALEWIGRQIPYCPWCLCSQADGHSPACARQAALIPAEAGEVDE